MSLRHKLYDRFADAIEDVGGLPEPNDMLAVVVNEFSEFLEDWEQLPMLSEEDHRYVGRVIRHELTGQEGERWWTHSRSS